MNYFDEFLSRNIVGEPTTEQIAVEEACRLFDGLAELVKVHESEIAKIQIDEAAMEAANYSGTNKYPVFILLTKGHSPLSKIIFTMTGDDHSHASIAFGIKLTSIYSFGTKKLNPKREMGFVHISANSDTWGEIPTEYDLFVTFVDYDAKKKMLQTLEYFTTNSERLKYHWAGLVKIFFHIKTRNQKAFICSRFVAAILGAGGVALSRDSSLYRPSQLRDIENVEYVISGPSIQKYDWKAAQKALDKIKEK